MQLLTNSMDIRKNKKLFKRKMLPYKFFLQKSPEENWSWQNFGKSAENTKEILQAKKTNILKMTKKTCIF